DGRVWVPKQKGDTRPPNQIPDQERDYYLERIYPSFGNLVPRDVASRQAKFRVDEGRGVGKTGVAVYLDFKDAIQRMGADAVSAKYGNLFQMYEQIAGENPYKVPMKIYPAVHYTMGGLWVDYNLQSTVPGLFVLGEANFSDHGANRLGASALMQGLADGYFVIPYTIAAHFTGKKLDPIDENHEAFRSSKEVQTQKLNKLLNIKGSKTVDEIHRELGHIMWENVGMSRSSQSLGKAIETIPKLREEFWQNVKVSGEANFKNSELEKAGRVADFLELGELMARDALTREESCGGHFREEHQTEENEAKRDDDKFCHVAAWESVGESQWSRHKEELKFENVKLVTRSYK
ncbi:MAG: FAD-binding protein, partial [Bdellovibrionales bacterium]|nr:FAD-binding protein [Bdellovibrionales bacterium]